MPSGSPAAIAAGPPIVTGVEGGVDYAAMASEQRVCPETTLLAANPSLSVKAVKFGDTSLLCDWSTGIPRPLVPAYSRKAVFTAIHCLAHPGIRAIHCTGHRRHSTHPHSSAAVLPHSCGFSGPSTSFGGRLHLPLHDDRPLFTMAGSGAIENDGQSGMC